MEYALDQDVIFEYGKAAQTLTGRVTGHSGKSFIVTLDHRLRDGSKTVLVPAAIVRPLACHWCRDAKRVSATPIAEGQFESGDIPQVDCPLCR